MLQQLFHIFFREIAPHLPQVHAVAANAKALSLRFTSARDERSRDYLKTSEALDAYIAAFVLPGAAKVLHCLQQLDALGHIPSEGPIAVLDLGTGPGTATLATALYLAHGRPGVHVRIAAMEQSRGALAKAQELFRHIAPPEHSLEGAVTHVSAASLKSALRDARFDIVIAANLLNELSEQAALELCEEIVASRLRENGALLVIDPALKETAQPLMRMRDTLLGERKASVLAPCLNQARCPMLAANERDWCHFYIDWKRPEYLEALDAASGMDHRHLKMAYFILGKNNGFGTRDSELETRTWRVVSSPLVSKGKREIVLCGEDGTLPRMRRLDREDSEMNRAFESAVRGDIVRCRPVERLDAMQSFEILARWNAFTPLRETWR